MTSTLGVWMLTGYGAAKAPRLMQFSVHCDHLRSEWFGKLFLSPYGETLAVLTTLLREKRFVPQSTATREGEAFMDCQLFSPYGETRTVLIRYFLQKNRFPEIQPREREKLNRFSKSIR